MKVNKKMYRSILIDILDLLNAEICSLELSKEPEIAYLYELKLNYDKILQNVVELNKLKNRTF